MPSEVLRPLKIARVLTRPAVGGAALHVALLTKYLRAPEFPTRVFAGRPQKREGDFYTLRAPDQTRPTTINSLVREPSLSRDLRALRDLVRHFRAFAPDIVDTHLSKAGILGRLAARLTGVPVTVHTFHINIFGGYEWRTGERELFLALERSCAAYTDRLICLSDDLGVQMQAMGIGDVQKWRTITLGLELPPSKCVSHRQIARERIGKELKIASNAPIIGLIARLAPVKSIKTLLDAAVFVLQRHANAHFVIVGDGPSRAKLELQAQELGIAHRVHFLGLRADIQVLNLAFDCVVLTSLQEGTPISLIESLSLARPVVATNVGGVARIIEHEKTGLLTVPRDAESTAQGILRILHSPREARFWGESGREKMLREFSVERLVSDHRALYHQVWQEKMMD